VIAAPRAHVLMSQFICACRPSKNQVRPSLSFHSLGHVLWTRITLVCTGASCSSSTLFRQDAHAPTPPPPPRVQHSHLRNCRGRACLKACLFGKVIVKLKVRSTSDSETREQTGPRTSTVYRVRRNPAAGWPRGRGTASLTSATRRPVKVTSIRTLTFYFYSSTTEREYRCP